MKKISATKKGNIAEDFLEKTLRFIGYQNIEVKKGRRGDWDVSLENKVFFEVKIATEDIHSSFQFNGIRYDTQYTHLFCLGITPNDIKYLIVEKKLLGLCPYKLVSMAKGSNSAFKLTQKLENLKKFAEFSDNIKRIIEKK